MCTSDVASVDGEADVCREVDEKAKGERRSSALRRLPRIEMSIVLLGFLCNGYGKYAAMSRLPTGGSARGFVELLAGDFLFVGLLLLGFAIAYRLFAYRWAGRMVLVAAVIYCIWSASNMAWLFATGVQIHVGVFKNLMSDPVEFGSIVTNRLWNTPQFTIPLVLCGLSAALIVLFRFIRPAPLSAGRLRKRLTILWSLLFCAIGLGLTLTFASGEPRRAALSYSSHWFGITSLIGLDAASIDSDLATDRHIPRRGERSIVPPDQAGRKPHVVLIVLESTAHWATSLGGQPTELTPVLAQLARDGLEFPTTRAVVTHTTQSQFSILTGETPNLSGGFAEAVLVDRPYETLATILGRRGYRSRFSQMVRATFECNPGLVANLGFDSFWAREDHGDPAANLGYLAGDDFKMIAPAFDWFDDQESPCFMFFMSSVAHDPYELPKWFGDTPTDERSAYLACIRYTDAFVGEIIARLEQRGVRDDTLICIVADHGEGMMDHDVSLHNENPYDVGLRVPWIISWPGGIAESRSVSGNHSLLDVAPTVLDVLGHDIRTAGFEGVSAIRKQAQDRKTFFAGWYEDSPAGYVEGNMKYVVWPRTKKAYEYDLSSDPQEKAPRVLDAMAYERLATELRQRRAAKRISFAPKRYRSLRLFDRWETSALGDVAWCYYVNESGIRQP